MKLFPSFECICFVFENIAFTKQTMESKNFEEDVIKRSFETPVVVDFWAPWCGPCRVLGPTIEQLAADQEGRWELVKLNTEEHPEIAQEYQVMSIPNVKLFRDGQPVAEFVGALPRTSIEQWLDEHIPSGEKLEFSTLLEQAQNMPAEQGRKLLEDFVAENPQMLEARVELAKHLAFERPQDALKMVEGITLGNEFYDTAEDIRTLFHFFEAPFEEHAPAAQSLQNAREALKNKQWDRGIEQIIEATTIDKSYQNDLPRKTAIALFHLWGDAHPATRNYRWKFDMALY